MAIAYLINVFNYLHLKKMDLHSRGRGQLSKLLLPTSEKESIVKRVCLFGRDLVSRKANKKSQKLLPL